MPRSGRRQRVREAAGILEWWARLVVGTVAFALGLMVVGLLVAVYTWDHSSDRGGPDARRGGPSAPATGPQDDDDRKRRLPRMEARESMTSAFRVIVHLPAQHTDTRCWQDDSARPAPKTGYVNAICTITATVWSERDTDEQAKSELFERAARQRGLISTLDRWTRPQPAPDPRPFAPPPPPGAGAALPVVDTPDDEPVPTVSPTADRPLPYALRATLTTNYRTEVRLP
ncbi:hypothetical protein [Streptomyces sp. SID3343]|uniref:hypothetical protein n=1 Tax=Streptomyces sp. SID3343 TaxID=2690260 RepID=UPI00136E8BE4|nr:hypothetical protein [Streptomyces sp. SID3343]MYW02932.1 hypothetical protein [Streptomyces sp. SID3343]